MKNKIKKRGVLYLKQQEQFTTKSVRAKKKRKNRGQTAFVPAELHSCGSKHFLPAQIFF